MLAKLIYSCVGVHLMQKFESFCAGLQRLMCVNRSWFCPPQHPYRRRAWERGKIRRSNPRWLFRVPLGKPGHDDSRGQEFGRSAITRWEKGCWKTDRGHVARSLVVNGESRTPSSYKNSSLSSDSASGSGCPDSDSTSLRRREERSRSIKSNFNW